ncbi:hypothetical protein CENSYa_0170 [Cenarchaeum symbiosum A]|uniref:Uncharacterized protein n=1 Tax=Cenarchaeum symbiosum (strain A) TaxID=414004 RepID=A0RTZ8_CENSY|nr:hypothetical protein CENSYa_0170 [Cenarchaeum symbiosum A]
METHVNFEDLPDFDSVAGMLIPEELADSISVDRVVDGKFWYFSEPCVAAYVSMLEASSAHTTYKDSMDCLTDNLTEIVEKILAEIPKQGGGPPRLDLVALGIGTARKECVILGRLLEEFKNTATRVSLVAVDFSYPLLMHGIRRVKTTFAYEKERFDLRLYVADYTKREAGDFGGTGDTFTLITAPGLLHNSPIPDIFYSLQKLMTKNTLLLIDAEMIGGRTDEELCSQYTDEPSKRFFFTPLSLLARASEEEHKRMDDQTGGGHKYKEFKSVGYVPERITAAVVCGNNLDEFRQSHGLPPGTLNGMKLSPGPGSKTVMITYKQDGSFYVLGHTARFLEIEFAAMLDRYGFEVVYECGHKRKHTRYYLLKMKTGDSPGAGSEDDDKSDASI